MKIKIRQGNYWYKKLINKEFDVIEKYGLLSKNLYYIKGEENKTKKNWFRKCDCQILDKDYLDGLNFLDIRGRLNYYLNEFQRIEKEIKSYSNGEHKEEFKDQNKCLELGAIYNKAEVLGKIELLENLLGLKGDLK